MCLFLPSLNTQYESQDAGDEYVRKAKVNTEYAGFLTELQMPAAAPIQQTERNGLKRNQVARDLHTGGYVA